MSALDQHATIKVIDTYGDGWDGAGMKRFQPTLPDTISPFDRPLTHHFSISSTFRSFLSGTISLYRDTKNLTTSNLLPIAQ